MNNITLEQISENDMTEKQKILFDRKLSVDAIPDLDLLTTNVCDILEYLDNPSTVKMLKNNSDVVERTLNNKYADTVPYSILKLLLDRENIVENTKMLISLFERLNDAKTGKKDLVELEKEYAIEMQKKYKIDEIYNKLAQTTNIDMKVKN